MSLHCWLLGHDWSPWEIKSVNAGYYDEERWSERVCTVCGKIDTEELEPLLWRVGQNKY
jgi:hypothetical protein